MKSRKSGAVRGLERKLKAARNRLLRALTRTASGRRLYRHALPDDVRYMIVDSGDHQVMVNPHEATGDFILSRGTWHRQQTDAVLKIVAKLKTARNRYALEVGANIGTQTLYMHLSGLFRGVIAVEPDSANVRLLRHNMNWNDFQATTITHEAAMALEDGTTLLYRDLTNHGRHNTQRRGDEREAVRVAAKTPAAVLQDSGVTKADIGFVWMDIEGAEKDVLPAVVDLIGPDVPVFFEYTPARYSDIERSRLLDYLEKTFDTWMLVDGVGNAEVCTPQQMASDPRKVDILVFNSGVTRRDEA